MSRRHHSGAATQTPLVFERVLGRGRIRRWTVKSLAAFIAAIPVGMGQQVGQNFVERAQADDAKDAEPDSREDTHESERRSFKQVLDEFDRRAPLAKLRNRT
jgi:hypothetical protein